MIDAMISDENRLGPYRLVRKLGEGGMGTVYLGFDEGLARHVAIKVLRMDGDRPESVITSLARRFMREAQSAAKLSSPHVVTIYSVGQQGTGAAARPYLVMEYIENGSLAEELHQKGQLPWREVARAMGDALSGLKAAHEAGIIHRDIKPANLMRTKHGGVKLVDFGLARAVYAPTDAEITIPGAFVGSPSYASPEQITGGGGRVDARSDLYSLAATAYALLTGQPPFVDDDPAEIMRKQVEEEFPDPREFGEVPQELVEILRKASRKNPALRYRGAAEMHAAIAALLAMPLAAERTPAPRKLIAKSSAAAESVVELERRLDAARSSHDETTELTTLRSLYGLYTQLDRREQAVGAARRALVLHVKMSQPGRARDEAYD